jgi:RNA polymerase sigma-70 factor (ECF subfamily)
MSDEAERRFSAVVLANLDAAYNLARWIVRDDAGAEDAVQEASLRAYRYLGGHAVDNAKPWFMAVVRNACVDWLKDNRRGSGDEPYDDDLHGSNDAGAERFRIAAPGDPERAAMRSDDVRWLVQSIESLPREYREVILLREIEGLSYKEIGSIVDIPIGTVMSRLARGREMLLRWWSSERARSKR